MRVYFTNIIFEVLWLELRLLKHMSIRVVLHLLDLTSGSLAKKSITCDGSQCEIAQFKPTVIYGHKTRSKTKKS